MLLLFTTLRQIVHYNYTGDVASASTLGEKEVDESVKQSEKPPFWEGIQI